MRITTLSDGERSVRCSGKVKRKLAKCLEFFLAMLMLMSVGIGGVTTGATDSANSTLNAEGYESSNYKEGSYGEYRSKNAGAQLYSGEPIVIKASDYKSTNLNVKVYDYEGVKDAVYIPEVTAEQEESGADITGDELELDLTKQDPGYITYNLTIEEAGLYEVYFHYYPVEGKGSTIERGFMIDGEYPFSESEYINFSRVWADVAAVGSVYDAAGNEIHPKIGETPEWRTEFLNNAQGNYSSAFRFYFDEGRHEIKIVSQKEPMLLAEIGFMVQDALPTYAEVEQEYAQNGYADSSGQIVKIEAEATYNKNSSSLYPYYNRGSAITTSVNGKFTYGHTQVNVIGGDFWKKSGDWMTWELTVPETGLYTISLRGRQNINRGLTSGRILTIDGEIPFEEAKTCTFNYSADFTIYTLGNSKTGEDFRFYFEAGKTYIIGLEATLGAVQGLSESMDSSVTELMEIYRRMLVLIGNSPDKERNYFFEDVMPDVLENMRVQANILYELCDVLYDIAGERTSQQVMLERTADRMLKMANRPSIIAKNFNEFKNDISAIAKWILELSYQPLELDCLYISSPDVDSLKANAGFFASIGHEIRLFWSSFTTDYTVVGTSSDESDAITVWFAPAAVGQIIGGGREQAQILKQMIEDDFIISYDIPVNLQLIDINALLPATLAGKGPDVSLQLPGDKPVQFAMRGAVYDIAQFDDYEEVAKRFYSSALTQFTYLDGVYGLPETQIFQVLFYRTDIMEELGLEIPQTWADVYDMIPELQNSHMNFGYPMNLTASLKTSANNYITFMYQKGAGLYRGEGNDLGYATNLDSPEAIEAFIEYVDLYRSYKIDVQVDFQTRFRSGEVPIGISNFTFINQLSVSAPEIRGLWDIALVPGMERVDEDGNTYIDRSVAADVTGCIILEKSEKKEQAWEFIKWWTSDETQVRYCLEVEATVGEAGRIPSANISVMRQQPWSNELYRLLSVQRSWAKGLPEVPGGYYTTRHMENAFNRTYSTMSDPRETLLDYIADINNELTKKRMEMGISTAEDILKRQSQTTGTD